MNEQLKEQDFSLKPDLKFTEDEQGLKFIEIDNALATAKRAISDLVHLYRQYVS